MIEELHTCIPKLAGPASHTRCFLHIVNLIAKTLICQFDAKKTTVEADSELAEIGEELTEQEHLLDEIVHGDKDEGAEENVNTGAHAPM